MFALQTARATFVAKPTTAARRSVKANAGSAKTGTGYSWLPGADTPEYLATLPGSYGFDPLGLGQDKASLERFVAGEVINGRWAMLGVAGMIGVEALGYGNWYDAPQWAVTGGKPTYFGAELPAFDLGTLAAIEIGLFAIAESLRGAAEGDKNVYPGGPFDPMGMSKGNLAELKTKEIKNGRLAMMAFLGMISQHAATGETPLAALKAHLADPLVNNFSTNGVSLPF